MFCNPWFLMDLFLVSVGVLAAMLEWLGPNSPLSIESPAALVTHMRHCAAGDACMFVVDSLLSRPI